MFIARRPDGSIYGLWTVRQWENQEELGDDHPEVISFINRPIPKQQPAIADVIAVLYPDQKAALAIKTAEAETSQLDTPPPA